MTCGLAIVIGLFLLVGGFGGKLTIHLPFGEFAGSAGAVILAVGLFITC